MMTGRDPSVNRASRSRLGGLCGPAERLGRLAVMQVREGVDAIGVGGVEVEQVTPGRQGDGMAEVLAGPRRQDELELRGPDLDVHQACERRELVRGQLRRL